MSLALYQGIVSPPRAFGGALGHGELKRECEDFQVTEQLGFEPQGHGEHVFLWVEKRDWNTQAVAERLCGLAGVRPVDVGYSGLKDRRAVCRQWFSVNSPPGQQLDWQQLQAEGLRLLSMQRHNKKLKIGSHVRNRFEIRVRSLTVGSAELEQRLQTIQASGFPNYFGTQRFGRDADNLRAAQAMFERVTAKARRKALKARGKDKLLLSAARSLLFNAVLAERVANDSWASALPGDVFQFEDGGSVFRADCDDELNARLEAQAVHATGPMYGDAGVQPESDALALEQQVLARYPGYRQGLQAFGMNGLRRALRARVHELDWHYDGESLRLSFELRRGSYATSLIREIVHF